ncbi:flagellar hook-associated protein 2 [Bacillus sp. 03113]|uniref:flagellar hook-associated protein 2 n=1 Tax=Bacillus sp. 03113 TaxID=2578211 RepID=UPI001143FD1C|nr:flagellar hook-associated protein 2 [Bacillus sp. 03113]
MVGIRVGGLASGMDIDQMVSDLMKAQRIPLDKINQKKQFTEWQRDDYRSMNSLLFDFDKFMFDGVMKQGSYLKKTVSILNPDAVSIKNINSTIDFSGTIKVNELASAATMSSKIPTSITDSTKKLSDFGVAAQQITIQAITKEGGLQTEPYTLTIDPTVDTLDSVIAKINKDSGVTAFFDTTSKKLSISAKNSGDIASSAEIILTDNGPGGGKFFNDVLQLNTNNDLAKINGVGKEGVNASVTYNGFDLTRSSNTFQINGVEFTLKKKTDPEIVSFSSSPDVDAIMDTVVKFVDKYNEAIDKINKKIKEDRYRDFQPLTSEQKKELSDKEVEQWEEKAKSGTLKNDSILSGSLNKMRLDLYGSVSGTSSFKQLTEIGISTTSNYLDGGKLNIDENKLRAAITNNPNGIYELFQKSGTTTEEKGLAQRLREAIKSTMKDIETKAGKSTSVNNTFTLGRILDNYTNQITRFNDRMMQVEDRYYRQFTAMEKAIQRANSQSNYLMQQFSN